MPGKTNPYLESYELGAMLNQLNFAMQQAYLLQDKFYYGLTIRLLETFVGRADEAVGSVAKAILEDWRDAWGTEDRMNELAQASDECERDGRTSAEAACRRLITFSVSPLIERLHSAFLAGDREKMKSIFAFGLVMDQSVRRDDIYRFLQQEVTTDTASNQNNKKFRKGTWELGGPSQRSRIADRVREPGSVSAGLAWGHAIRRDWLQLNIEVPIPDAAINNLVSRDRAEEAKNDYEVIDQAARRGLWLLWLNGPGRPQPEWDSGRRILRVADFTRQVHPNAKKLIPILDSFQELGWSSTIDDPLPPDPDLVPEKVLADAVTGLNKGMEDCTIRFAMRNSGKGIGWDPKIPE